MTLRITLLVLATGLFALIWTQDGPRPKDAKTSSEMAQAMKPADAELAASSESIAFEQIEIREMMGRAVSHSSSAIPMPEVPEDAAWMFNDCAMPLPTGIVPGEYRAVSNTGLIREFNLTLDDLQTYRGVKSAFVTRDIYESESESLRWYFIRVQSDAGEIASVIAERSEHKILPAIAQRSDVKLLENEASRLIVSAGQRMAFRLYRMIQSQSPARFSSEIKDRIRL